MPERNVKIVRIGNSSGVRLAAETLRRYRIRNGDTVVMEERSEGILLRPGPRTVEKLSWQETAREMAASGEDWSEWEATAGDGLDQVPWSPGGDAVHETKAAYERRSRTRKRP